MSLIPVGARKAIVYCVVLHVIGIDTNNIIPLEPDSKSVFKRCRYR